MTEFVGFPKIARLNREIVVTEKLDGTNAQVTISDDGHEIIGIGSRNRLITLSDDNFGFAAWVHANKQDLLRLGPGRHFGEWWGHGIQRGYQLLRGERRFSLFNVGRWGSDPLNPNPDVPACCSVVPTLYRGPFSQHAIEGCLEELRNDGSYASPGFMRPEGIVIYHTAGGHLYKVTLHGDEAPKSADPTFVRRDHDKVAA